MISKVSTKTSAIPRAVASPSRWADCTKLSGKLIVMLTVIRSNMFCSNYSNLPEVWMFSIT